LSEYFLFSYLDIQFQLRDTDSHSDTHTHTGLNFQLFSYCFDITLIIIIISIILLKIIELHYTSQVLYFLYWATFKYRYPGITLKKLNNN